MVTCLRQSFSFKEGPWSGVATYAIWLQPQANLTLSPDSEAISRFADQKLLPRESIAMAYG